MYPQKPGIPSLCIMITHRTPNADLPSSISSSEDNLGCHAALQVLLLLPGISHHQIVSMRQSRMVSILCCVSKSNPPSFSARGVHRIGVSFAMYAARIESAPVPRALQMSIKVGRAGISSPRSIREIELEATSVSSASCFWVILCSLRMCCIACPPYFGL